MREHPLSLAHLSLLDLSPTELIATAADAGFDAVSLRISPAHEKDTPFPLTTDPALLRQTRQAMDETGVGVLDVEVVRLDAETDLAALGPVISTAAGLGARYMVVMSADPDHGRLGDRFAQLCQSAAPAGLRPVLEFVPYSSVRRLAEAVQIVGRSGGGVLVDALHLQRSGGSPADLHDIDPALLPYVQLCDAPRAAPDGGLEEIRRESRHARLPPGDGELPLPGLLTALRQADLPVSVEVPSDALRSHYGDQEFARRLRSSAVSVLRLRPLDPRPFGAGL